MKSDHGLAVLLRRRLPILEWGPQYSGQTLVGDLVAAAIVSMMLIPQSLAYALLVGLPPQLGLYASMAPLLLYAVFGTSRALAVGPVAGEGGGGLGELSHAPCEVGRSALSWMIPELFKGNWAGSIPI